MRAAAGGADCSVAGSLTRLRSWSLYTLQLEAHTSVHAATSPGLRRFDLVVIATVAAAARTFNLGTFSLWLDEILLALRAQGSFADTWAACRANAEHPPLSALAMNVLYDLGATDTVQRLLPIALGVAATALLALWIGRHFGRLAGLFTGLVMALTATQVRYAQELRPYAYLLFFVTLALHAADRWDERRRWRDLALLAGVLAAGLYSHYLAAFTPAILALPLLPRLLTRDRAGRRAAAYGLVGLAAAGASALLLFVPWLTTIATVAGRAAKGGTAHWTLAGAASRWEVLTVGMRDGDPWTWAGLATLALALVGAVQAARSAAGWVVIAGAVAGTVGVELLLLQARHWSSARYDLFGALFICCLIGIGAGRVARLRPRPLPALLVLGVVAAIAWNALGRYAAYGRPEWDRIAAAVATLREPGERIFTENEWTRMSLAYYLQGRDFERRTKEELAPIAVRSRVGRLAEGWPASACALMIAAGNPLYPPLEARLGRFPLLAHFPSSDEARIYLLTPAVRQQLYDSGWPEVGPADLAAAGCCGGEPRILPPSLRVPSPFPWARLLRALGASGPAAGETVRLDFDRATTARALARGWSGFERAGDDATFVWAIGNEALLTVACEHPRRRLIRVRVQPAEAPGPGQSLAASLNGAPIGEAVLVPGFQTVWFESEATHWRQGENLLAFRFRRTVSPRQHDPAAADSRPLAAAFDRIDFLER